MILVPITPFRFPTLRREFIPQQGSVQVWQGRANKMGIGKFPLFQGVYYWTLDYDDFLGYMKGVLVALDAELGGILCA